MCTAGVVIKPITHECDGLLPAGFPGQKCFEVAGDRLQGQLGITAPVSIDQLHPSPLAAVAERFNKRLEANVVVNRSVASNNDIRVAPDEHTGSGRNVAQRVERGNGFEASFQRGNIVGGSDQGGAPADRFVN